MLVPPGLGDTLLDLPLFLMGILCASFPGSLFFPPQKLNRKLDLGIQWLRNGSVSTIRWDEGGGMENQKEILRLDCRSCCQE